MHRNQEVEYFLLEPVQHFPPALAGLTLPADKRELKCKGVDLRGANWSLEWQLIANFFPFLFFRPFNNSSFPSFLSFFKKENELGLCWIPSTYMVLTTVCISSFQGSNALRGSPWTAGSEIAHIHEIKTNEILKINILKLFFKSELLRISGWDYSPTETSHRDEL